MEGIQLLANTLANRGKRVAFRQNSIFNMWNGNSNDRSAVVASISTMIGNEVNIYRNQYIPFMQEYEELVSQTIASKLGNVDLSEYKVVSIGVPTYINLLIDGNRISTSANKRSLDVSPLTIPFPGMSIANDYLVDKIPSKQMALDEILGDYDDAAIQDLWEKYLLNISPANDAWNKLSSSSPILMNEATLLYHIVTKLKEVRPDNVRASEIVYLNAIRNMEAKLVGDIAGMYKNISSYKKFNRLVIVVKDTTIYVVEDLYKTFLANNTVEVLLGLIIVNGSASIKNYYIDDIEINKDDYVVAWNKTVKLKTIAVRNNDVAAYRLGYIIALEKLYQDLTPEMQESLSMDLNSAKTIITDYLKKSNMAEISEVKKISQSIITELLLGDTNFGIFVKNMISYAKLDESTTPKEAASLATLDLIVDYLTEQITTEV